MPENTDQILDFLDALEFDTDLEQIMHDNQITSS